MPRERIIGTLQNWCIKQIAELLWNWRLNSPGTFLDEVDEVIRTYFIIPPVFTEPILEAIKENGHEVYTGHVSLLVKQGMSSILLTGHYDVDFDHFIKYTANHLKHVAYLDISRRWMIPEVMVSLAQLIPNVQVLKLQFTRVTDAILENITDHCLQIKTLDVSYCPVGDHGLKKLCHKCPNLINLHISETRVTTAGAAYMLRNAPQLQKLEYGSMVDVLMELYGMQLGILSKCASLNLRLMRLSLEPKASRKLCPHWSAESDQLSIVSCCQIMAAACPKLTTIVINDWNPSQEWSLHLLAHCQSMSELILDVSSYPYLTMRVILPLLVACGRNLKVLTIKHVADVDICKVSENCWKNLLELTLEDNTYAHLSEHINDCIVWQQFAQLDILEITGNMPDHILYTLLTSCPSITDLSIYHNYELTYDLLVKVTCRSPMPNLGLVTFKECDCLTLQALQLLIQSENDLHYLEVNNCRVSDHEYWVLIRWMERYVPTAGVEIVFESRIY